MKSQRQEQGHLLSSLFQIERATPRDLHFSQPVVAVKADEEAQTLHVILEEVAGGWTDSSNGQCNFAASLLDKSYVGDGWKD